jgi:hypothetical protein
MIAWLANVAIRLRAFRERIQWPAAAGAITRPHDHVRSALLDLDEHLGQHGLIVLEIAVHDGDGRRRRSQHSLDTG